MYKLTSNPEMVIDTTDGACVPVGAGNYRAQAYADWLAAGNSPLPVDPPTVNQIVQRFLPQLQSWLDGIAQQNGYDSALSCISYVGSSVSQWDTDARAMLAYRDALWVWAYQQQIALNAMTETQLEGLTAESIIAQAPKAEDHGWIVHGN